MDWIDAIILGVVQGLTEFLPVSSTAHVMLAGRLLFGAEAEPSWMTAFSAIIQLGTMAAVLIYFLKDIGRIVKAWFLSLIGKVPRSDPDARMGWFVIVGTIPVAVIGLGLQDVISSTFRNLWVTVAMLFGVGIVLWVADTHTARLEEYAFDDEYWEYDEGPTPPPVVEGPTSSRDFFDDDDPDQTTRIRPVVIEEPPPPSGLRQLNEMTWLHAIIFGLAQAAALIPGVSRSGATTSAGLFLGYDRPSAARYSFLLSVPAVWASGLYEVYELKDMGTEAMLWGPTLVATFFSFVVGYAVIAWLLRFVSTHTFRPFAVYRIVVAVAVAGMLLTGVLQAGGA